MPGFKRIVEEIAKDLEKRLPKQRTTQRRKLSELVGRLGEIINPARWLQRGKMYRKASSSINASAVSFKN